MSIQLFVFGADRSLKEALEKRQSTFLSETDRLLVAGNSANFEEYLANQVSKLCVENQESLPLHVVALLLNSTSSRLAELRECFPSIFFVRYEQRPIHYAQVAKFIRLELGQIRRLFRAIMKEIRERDSKTPLLLPLVNFDALPLVQALADIQDIRSVNPDYTPALKSLIDRLEAAGVRPHSDGKKPFFRNNRSLRFYGPKKSGARHGKPSALPPHTNLCLINGYFRIGTRYDIRFHYDCCNEHTTVNGLFMNCHGDYISIRNKTYINIAPNDNVRA